MPTCINSHQFETLACKLCSNLQRSQVSRPALCFALRVQELPGSFFLHKVLVSVFCISPILRPVPFFRCLFCPLPGEPMYWTENKGSALRKSEKRLLKSEKILLKIPPKNVSRRQNHLFQLWYMVLVIGEDRRRASVKIYSKSNGQGSTPVYLGVLE